MPWQYRRAEHRCNDNRLKQVLAHVNNSSPRLTHKIVLFNSPKLPRHVLPGRCYEILVKLGSESNKHAAIDVEYLAGHPFRLVAGQIDGRMRDIIWTTEPANAGSTDEDP